MKRLLLIILVLTSCTVQAQWGSEVGLHYVYANPSGGMGMVIKRGHGVSVNYGFVAPSEHFSIGAEMSYAQYGRDKSRQEYTFDDGTVAPMDIIVSNYYITLTAYSRWYFRTEGSLRPYVSGKLGYARFNTDLNIYDPDDDDHCEPVERDVLYHDGTLIGQLGAGVKMDMQLIFKKLDPNVFSFEGFLGFTQGGQVSYMNADAEPQHQHHSPPGTDHVTADFINTQTQIIHKHHVGYLYSNPVQMLEMRLGFALYFGR